MGDGADGERVARGPLWLFAESSPCLVAGALLVACSGKAWHLDDANFLNLADALRAHLGTPWTGLASNPPGNLYLLALVTSLFGESERAVHLALVPLTLCALLGTRWLSAELGIRPAWLAPLLVSCSGAFLLSATTLMPDATMLGLLVPAIAALLSDEREPRAWKLALSTLLFATGWSLRYSGGPVLLLAAGLSLLRGNRRAWVPLAALAAVVLAWVVGERVHSGTSYAIAGPAKLMGSPGALLLWRILSSSAALALFTAVPIAAALLVPARGARRFLELGALCCAAAAPFAPYAAALMALATVSWLVARAPRAVRPDATDALLCGWALLALAVPVLYGQAAAKYLNLALPPLLLLVVRHAPEQRRLRRGLAAACIALSVAVPAAVADQRHAALLKELVFTQVARARAASPSGHVWVAGTPWGALRYAEQAGARFLFSDLAPGSAEAALLAPGDEVLDVSYPGSLALPPDAAVLEESGALDDAFPLRLMSDGAGLWSSHWGLLPFVVSRQPIMPWWRVRIARRVLR